ncbi:MAG: tyrosine-type recombinase/integrase [Clostridia bacterium]|nr:tyrosine-type recombinase/integrase [Clostridia bacterium]
MATGHIHKREGVNGDVSYQIIVEVERNPLTGKRQRTYKTIKGTKKQAEIMLRKMISDLESGNITTPSAMKLGEWLTHWLATYCPNLAVSTRAGYEEKINNYIIPALGHIPLKALKADNVQTFINGMQQSGLSPKTIRNAYNNLNAALKKAVILRMIPYNPCEGTVLPKLVKHQDKVYDNAEIREVLKKAEDTDIYLMVLLLVTTGLRRGELDALKWSHIDFEAKTINICESRTVTKDITVTKAPKSQAGNRTITVGDEVITALEKAREEYYDKKERYGAGFHDLGYVICKKNGEPYRPDSLTQKWLRFVEKNNLQHVRLHGLRHSNATALIQAGVSPKVVQQRLGHADINITLNTYTHVLPSMDKEAAEKIDNMILKAE